jgi:hypothetical protein
LKAPFQHMPIYRPGGKERLVIGASICILSCVLPEV